jgi:hypothetical protein
MRQQHVAQHRDTAAAPKAHVDPNALPDRALIGQGVDQTGAALVKPLAAPTVPPPQQKQSSDVQRHAALPCAAVGEPPRQGLAQQLRVCFLAGTANLISTAGLQTVSVGNR